jgi:hypothetical protein
LVRSGAGVSEDQRKLEIFTKLPLILNKDRVDERNARCFKNSRGEPLYPPSHIHSVSHKQALGTYARNEKGEVVFKQTIYLPFRVAKDPVKLGAKEGVQIYFFGQQGEIKMLAVELVSADSHNKCTTEHIPRGYDHISVAGSNQHTRIGGGSFYCVNPDTGRPDPRVAGFPRTINTYGTYRTDRARLDDVLQHSIDTRRTDGTSTYRTNQSRGMSTHRSIETHRTQGTQRSHRRNSTSSSNHNERRSVGNNTDSRVDRAPSVAQLPERNGEENLDGDSLSSTIRTTEGHFQRSSCKKQRVTKNAPPCNIGSRSINL